MSSVVAVGVTGGIAAYKACDLVRRLQDAGHEVRAVMTESAQQFVTPLTLEVLTGFPVITDQFLHSQEYGINHVGLARRADCLVIAPATANTLARMAHGVADDFLTTMVLATYAPIVVAPSMNTAMWRAEATLENLAVLRARGVEVVPPGSGSLACGEEGEGRLAEVADIVSAVGVALRQRSSMKGLKVLVNAGPTREALDAVRFLSNPSTGKMGLALAAAARNRGAEVTLVLGPVQARIPEGVAVVSVTSAAEMLDATLNAASGCDIAVLSAAVSDFTPKHPVEGKVKKGDATPEVSLVPTADVLRAVSESVRPPVLIGFAAEYGDPEAEAARKCREKGCDLVVGNDISQPGTGFGADDNRAVLVEADGSVERTGLVSKRELAERIWDRALATLDVRRRPSVVRSGDADTA